MFFEGSAKKPIAEQRMYARMSCDDETPNSLEVNECQSMISIANLNIAYHTIVIVYLALGWLYYPVQTRW